MNYLAHAFLSGADKQILVGNFIADAVKGKAVDNYPDEIRRGIILHRFIDEYTDHHAMHRASRSKLTSRYRHYAGVLVDIYYDHYLAKNWQQYAEISLDKFTTGVYQTLTGYQDILPEKIQYMLKYMVPQNWLLNYAHLSGIERVLKGMANRAKFDSQMQHGVEDLELNYTDFEEEFTMFFPDLQQFVDEKIQSII